MNWFLHESRQYSAWLLSVCLFGTAPCHANDDAISEKDYLQDLPVVLSASRLNQTLSETPNAVTVIDRDMIKASGFRNLHDVFRLVPGMFVDNFDGHTPIVAYHGSTDQYSRRMQVLVDGRSVYLPPFSHVVWGDIPLQIDDIERIEVVRGPAAASHGANSFQGVINIITRDAGSVHGASVSVTKGDGGVSDMAAHLGRSGADLDYRVTLGYRADDGLDTNIVNDSSVTRMAILRANYHPNGSDSIDFQLGYNEGVWGAGVAARSTDPFRDTSVHSSFQQLAWLHVRPQGDEFRLQYYHVDRHLTDPLVALLPSAVVQALQVSLDPETVVHRHDLELQHTLLLGANNRLVWGGGVRTDSADSLFNLKTGQALTQSRIFAHDEWRVSPAALLNMGAMFEKDGMGHAKSSPRVSLNYHLAPQQTVRVGTSVAYRSPAIVEEHGYTPSYFLASGGLQPEKIRSNEIGYLGEFRTLGLTVDARFFYDKVSDIIFPDPLKQPGLGKRPYDFRNLLGATEKGFESTIKYRWRDRNSLVFNYASLSVDCTITGAPSRVDALPDLQDYINTCPAIGTWNSGSVLLTQQVMHDIQISAGYYRQKPLPVLNFSKATVMSRVDLRLAKSFGKPGAYASGEVALVLQNAFQNGYSELSPTPQTDFIKLFNRRAYLTATLNF